MSGDHNEYQKTKSYLDDDFECPRCGHCCQALETEQEPVAWISDSPTKGNGKQLHWTKSEAWRWSSNITPLYTAPPKRTWVGLTGKDIDDCYFAARTPDFDLWAFAAEIDDLLREKNKW